jgi:erythritol transport system ATP-binding protein
MTAVVPTPSAVATNGPAHPVVLAARKVVKSYPGTTALKRVDFEVRAGAVNVLVGENGAGKSTLMKIIAGVEQPSAGELLLDGRHLALRGTADARKHGIGIVFQELNLFPNLSIAENLFIGNELTAAGGLAIDAREQQRRATALMAQLEHPLDVRIPVGELRIGQQQIVEIAKALTREARILILDEPTSALSAPEVEILFRVIRELKARGVAIVYISHRLQELIRIGEYVTVMREGRITGTARIADVDVPWIVRMMVGSSVRDYARPLEHRIGPPLLEARNVTLARRGAPGRVVVDVSFDLRQGEIVGIYGLMGAGRTELLECILGRHAGAVRGEIRLAGNALRGADVAATIGAGLALIPEDRKADGLVHTMSVAENLTLACLQRLARHGFLKASDEASAVRRFVASLAIKVADTRAEIGALSGGNQQKVLIARALMTQPKVLLMDEPSRGIDIGAKAEVFALMRDLSANGMAILFVTSDLDEVIALSDRILVMSQGKVTARFEAAEATVGDIVAASAVGHAVAA